MCREIAVVPATPSADLSPAAVDGQTAKPGSEGWGASKPETWPGSAGIVGDR